MIMYWIIEYFDIVVLGATQDGLVDNIIWTHDYIVAIFDLCIDYNNMVICSHKNMAKWLSGISISVIFIADMIWSLWIV